MGNPAFLVILIIYLLGVSRGLLSLIIKTEYVKTVTFSVQNANISFHRIAMRK